jgi:hypothetical protein
MVFELIPLPISILFVAIFVMVALVVLWKIRKRGKVYLILFSFSMIIVLAFIVLVAAVIASALLTSAGPVEIQITTDKPSYEPNEQVHFSIHINNPHDWRVPYPSSISYQIGSISAGKGFPNYSFFFPHSKTLLDTYSWGIRQPGNYSLTVTLRGDTDYSKPANYTVNIEPIQ